MRRISFSHTLDQFRDGSKDVTRRLGWKFLVAGDHLMGIEKGMGLERGQSQVTIGEIGVVSVTFEPLDAITQEDVRREGFPDWTPEYFIAFFMKSFRCERSREVTRIEFRRLERAEDGGTVRGTQRML